MHSLQHRDREPEWMDRPDVEAGPHRQALRGLRRINRLSTVTGHLWRRLRAIAKADSSHSLRVLDVACGGGDVTTRLALRAQRAGAAMDFFGCDVSPTAVAAADHAARQAGARRLEFFRYDVLADGTPAEYDVVLCTLFLHHLSEENAEKLLRRMAASAQRAVLVDDLLRTRLGHWLAVAGCRALTRSAIVHHDGPLSVRAAFTLSEAQAIAERAGLVDARWTRHWPQRFLMHWNRQ